MSVNSDPLKPSDFGLKKVHFGDTKDERNKNYGNFRNNLKVLSTLTPDKILFVDKKNPDRLKAEKLSTISRLAYRFRRQKRNEKEVKQLVKTVVKKLDFNIDQQLEEATKEIKETKTKLKEAQAAFKDNPNDSNSKKLRKISDRLEALKQDREKLIEDKGKIQSSLSSLLTERMSSLSENIYNRGKIKQSVVDILKPELKEDKEFKKELSDEIQKLKKKVASLEAKKASLHNEKKALEDLLKRKDIVSVRNAKKAKVKAKQKKIDSITEDIKTNKAIIAKLERKLALQKADRRINKVKFAYELGIKMKPVDAGMSGTYFAKDYKGKIKGVFKPAAQESMTGDSPKLKERIKKTIIKMLPIRDPAAPFHAKEGYLAEAMTTTLAKHLRFRTVPAAKVTVLSAGNLKDAKGSFQVFAKNTTAAEDTVLKLKKTEIEKTLSPEEIEELFLIDFLTYNRDRHGQNWLVSEPNPVTGKRTISLIDHGLSFPKQHPSEDDILLGFSFYGRNQFKYAANLPLDREFTPEMKERIKERLTGVLRDKLMAQLKATDPDVTHFDEEDADGNSQKKMLDQRIDVLLYCIENNWTIRDIATIKTQEDIDRTLGL